MDSTGHCLSWRPMAVAGGWGGTSTIEHRQTFGPIYALGLLAQLFSQATFSLAQQFNFSVYRHQ